MGFVGEAAVGGGFAAEEFDAEQATDAGDEREAEGPVLAVRACASDEPGWVLKAYSRRLLEPSASSS